MSIKHLLGLQACPMTDEEVMQAIENARRKQIEEVEFPLPKKKVRLRLNAVKRDGIMREYWDYYS